jgi:hypothetical protein
MALKLFTIEDDESTVEVDNTSNYITAFHDTSDGSYKITKFYITNDPTWTGYENIEIAISIGAQTNGPISSNGIVYQLLAVDSLSQVPSGNLWEHLPYNNTVEISSIPVNTETTRYFALRTYVPRGHGANYLSEASIVISATEIVD